MPNLRGGEKGDLLVRIHVEVPRKLTDDQRKKLEEFAVACGDNTDKGSSEPFYKKFF